MPHDVTFLIPTHCRPGYLGRVLAYYGSAGIAPLVADSSPQAYAGDLPPGTTYLHLPGLAYLAKLARVAERIQTPFVVFCADDDFTVPRAVLACRDFLLEHPDHATAQGDFYEAVPPGPAGSGAAQGPGLRLISTQAGQVRVDSARPEERMLQAMAPYLPTFYAVQRTAVLRDYIRAAAQGVENYNLLELCQALTGAIHGRHAQLPLFYGVREAVPSQDPKDPRRRHGVGRVSRDPAYAGEYGRFLDALTVLLTERHGLARAGARQAVAAAVEAFAARYCGQTPRRTFFQKLPKYVRRLAGLPSGRSEAADLAREGTIVAERFAVYNAESARERDEILGLVARGPL